MSQYYFDQMEDSDIMHILRICESSDINLSAEKLRKIQERAGLSIQTVSSKKRGSPKQVMGFVVHKEFDDQASIMHIGAFPEYVDEVVNIVIGDMQSYCTRISAMIPETNIVMCKALAKRGLPCKLVAKPEGPDKIQFTWEGANAPKNSVTIARR